MTSEAVKTSFHLTTRQKQILPLLMLGSFFEGFDFSTVNLALPFITRDLAIDTRTAGYMLSVIAVGTLLSFFVVRLGDKVGRKPVFLGAVATYSVLSFLTALTPNTYLFILCQFLARTFLVVSWATGFIIVVEEFEAETAAGPWECFRRRLESGQYFPPFSCPCWPICILAGGVYIL
jgi:putative MFS transporter